MRVVLYQIKVKTNIYQTKLYLAKLELPRGAKRLIYRLFDIVLGLAGTSIIESQPIYHYNTTSS